MKKSKTRKKTTKTELQEQVIKPHGYYYHVNGATIKTYGLSENSSGEPYILVEAATGLISGFYTCDCFDPHWKVASLEDFEKAKQEASKIKRQKDKWRENNYQAQRFST